MIRIILVDDHEILRNGLRKLMDDEADINVIGEAENGREAIRLSNELKPEIIVMDMIMHDMNGIEATRQIKAVNPDIKIIALSGHSTKQIVTGIIKAGAAGYVLKDSSHKELLTAIRSVHFGNSYLSEDIADVVVGVFSSGLNSKKEMDADPLTYRQNEILQLLSEGRSVGQIASSLFISPKTVASHRANIMDILNIRNLPMLTKYAINTGLTSLDI